MNKELKIIDEIDFVLHFLATSPDVKEYLTHPELREILWKYLKSFGKSMSQERFAKILNKLSNDKYIEQNSSEIPRPEPITQVDKHNMANKPLDKITKDRISYDGLNLEEMGGYRSKYIKKNRIYIILKWQFCLTLILAIGASIASFYYILEIIKFFNCK